MKLCPQCEFIYEDDQTFCDMDGKELVYNSTSGLRAGDVVAANIASPKLSATRPVRSRRLPAVITVAAVLVVLLTLIVLGYRLQSRKIYAAVPPIESSQQRGRDDISPQPSPEASADPSLSPAANVNASPEAPVVEAPVTQVTDVPPAASGLAAKQSAPVLLRLSNGAVIRADDAGETRNGIWYRQGGMVTLLKRSRVTAIERGPASAPKPTAPAPKIATASAAPPQNQLRIRRLEPATPKRESRVTSFLKKTGQILSKPFKR